jgi:hypothetical protein
MHLPKFPRKCSPLIAVALTALVFACAGCVDEPAKGGYSGGYTGNQATVDEDNAAVNYDYTLDGPRTVMIAPEKLEVSPGEEISVKVTVRNTGTEQFYAPNKLSDRIKLLSRYSNEDAPPPETPNPAAAPVMLKCHAVAPGDSVSLKLHFTAGDKPGTEILSTNVSGPGEEVQVQVR